MQEEELSVLFISRFGWPDGQRHDVHDWPLKGNTQADDHMKAPYSNDRQCMMMKHVH